MKKIMAIALALVLFLGVLPLAVAEDGYYNYTWMGVIICTSCSVRKTQNSNGERYGTVKNGQVVRVLSDNNGWVSVDLEPLGYGQGVGYIKSALVKQSPCYLVMTQYTMGYDDPWYTGQRNGEFDKGSVKLLKSTSERFYCVQTQHGSAGSSFIRIEDVGRFTDECDPGWAYVMQDGNLFDMMDGYQLGTLKKGKLVTVLEWGEYICKILDDDGNVIWTDAPLGPVVN